MSPPHPPICHPEPKAKDPTRKSFDAVSLRLSFFGNASPVVSEALPCFRRVAASAFKEGACFLQLPAGFCGKSN